MRRAAVPLTVLLLLVLPGAAAQAAQASPATIDPDLAQAVAALGPGQRTLAVAVLDRDAVAGAVAGFDRLDIPHTTLSRTGVSQLVVDAESLAAAAHVPGVRALWSEQVLDLHLEDSRSLLHVEAAWAVGQTQGGGAAVLVIDTGLDGLHPDLADRIRALAQPLDPLESGLLPEGYLEGLPANDWFGHGTHVAGIVAGTGVAAGELDPSHGRFTGVAPAADLVGWSIPGLGNQQTVFQAIQGFEYALEHQERFGLRVITNSWGISAPYNPLHPVNQASLAAYEAGMAIVFSAGNAGTPGGNATATNMFSTAPWAISVAASDKQDRLASFSSRGTDPAATDRWWDHPTITAPGVSILAAKSRTGAMAALGPAYAPSPDAEPEAQATHYQYASGTSMSGPMVAGILALLFAANPDLSPDQSYDLLVATADPMPEHEYWEVGAGMANASAAVSAALATEGRLAQFLDGARAYGDPDDVLREPLKAHLVAQGDLTPPPASPPGAGDQDRPEAPGIPGPGAVVLFLAAVLAALTWRRRPAA